MAQHEAHRRPARRKISEGPAATPAANPPAGAPAAEPPVPARLTSIRVEAPAQPAVTTLPSALRSGIEALTGQSMGDVRVHYQSDRPAALNALAYSQGRDIFVAPGGETRLPHEAWHVAQQ